jgi:hypothetical protein
MAEVTNAIEDALRMRAISFDAVKHLLLCRIEQRPPRLDPQTGSDPMWAFQLTRCHAVIESGGIPNSVTRQHGGFSALSAPPRPATSHPRHGRHASPAVRKVRMHGGEFALRFRGSWNPTGRRVSSIPQGSGAEGTARHAGCCLWSWVQYVGRICCLPVSMSRITPPAQSARTVDFRTRRVAPRCPAPPCAS